MLTALLPGIRGIRSSLVAGYMWFGAVWLLVNHFWPASAEPMLTKPIVELVELFGTGGKLIVISTLCLLIGEVTSTTVQSFFFRLSQRCLAEITPPNIMKPRKGWRRLFWPMSTRSLNRLHTKIVREYHIDDDPPGAAEHQAMEAVREVLYISPRLIVAKPELYNEYDRIKSESEFRDALLLPLPILGLAVCLNLNTSWLVKVALLILVLLLDCYLFLQARRQFRTAHSMVAHSVADGTISSAALDRVKVPKALQ
jgi:hypothetical protein